MPVVTAPRDPSWTTTSLAPDVIAYLNYLRNSRMSAKTVGNREAVLAVVCNRLDGWHLGCAELTGCPRCLTGKQGRQVLEDVLIAREWKDLQANSLDTYISTLKAFFGWAYDEELILRDPTRRIARPKLPKRRYDLFSTSEHESLLGAQPFERDRIALMLHFEFAMRAADLRLLQLGDVDVGRQTVRLKNGKGQTDETLAFRTRTVLEATRDYLAVRDGHADEFLLYPMRNTNRGSYQPGVEVLCESRMGEPWREPQKDGYWTEYYEFEPKEARRGGRLDPYSVTGFRQWWRRCEARAELSHRRPHLARHTTGTWMAGDDLDFRTVSMFLRHKDMKTTGLYVHLNELEQMRSKLWRDK